MLWRFSANHTHLYPGARLRSLDAPNKARLSPGDDVLVEFSDGALASGQWGDTDADAAVLQMSAHRTQRGTEVAARTWRLVPAGEPGWFRVQQRLPAA